jgi:hypothetical protein
MHLVGMDTLLILLSLGPGHHHPRARMSHFLIKPAIQTSTSTLTPTRFRFCKNSSHTFSVTPRPIPEPAVLTLGSSLGSYIVLIDQHESFVRTLSSLMRTRENFPVGHPSQIAPSQAHLTWRFFRDRLPKKMYLFCMNTLLNLGSGHHHPMCQDITINPLRRLTSSSVNPNLGTSPLNHVCVSSVVICCRVP